jgi:hypothetical protein
MSRVNSQDNRTMTVACTATLLWAGGASPTSASIEQQSLLEPSLMLATFDFDCSDCARAGPAGGAGLFVCLIPKQEWA